MILWGAKDHAQAYAKQPISDVVITVPSFFNRAERTAIAIAAEIAGLNLLQVSVCLLSTFNKLLILIYYNKYCFIV